MPERIERYEAEILKEALRAQRGDVKATIEALGIPRKTFYDKLQRHGINRADYADRPASEKPVR
ncbi:C4-dicarboxylate transport transcriptional regulatory protein DctD [compost metagenome]